MDYSKLAAADLGKPISTVTSDPYKALDGTPFETWVKSTHAAKSAKYVDVADDKTATQVVHLLRLAAKKLGLGVRIPQPHEKVNGKIRVVFQGKDRAKHDSSKLRKPGKPRKGESQDSFKARVRAWEAQQPEGTKWTAPTKSAVKATPAAPKR
jgi:hypothetical protein